MQLIALVDKNWAIGKKGQQLVTIPADQKIFRQETQGKVVVMGRKTLLALPGERPLDDRINIVLTKDETFRIRGAEICHSMEETLRKLEEYKEQRSLHDEDIYIIGGQSIYEQFLPYCDVAHITYVDYEYEADTYMVNLEKMGWKLEESSEEQTYFNLCYEFRKYTRILCV
ncbi:MAG: dihydrofolate reductase [Clostridium sp.]